MRDSAAAAKPAFDSKRLRQAREEKGWTRERLAVEAGTKVRTLIAWESGIREPEAPNLRKLADSLGLSGGDLLAVPRAQWSMGDLRHAAGFQQRDAAKQLGVGAETLRHIERGASELLEGMAGKLAVLYTGPNLAVTVDEIEACWQRAREALTNPPPPAEEP